MKHVKLDPCCCCNTALGHTGHAHDTLSNMSREKTATAHLCRCSCRRRSWQDAAIFDRLFQKIFAPLILLFIYLFYSVGGGGGATEGDDIIIL